MIARNRPLSLRNCCILIVLAAVFALAADSAQATMAETHQANARVNSIGTTTMSGMYRLLGCNDEYAWPAMGGPIPPGAPSGAVAVFVSRWCESQHWQHVCEAMCTRGAQSVNISIHFSDGSVYTFRAFTSRISCTNGDFEVVSHYSDSASGYGYHRIRSDYYRRSRMGSTRSETIEEKRDGGWRAAGGTLTLTADAQELVGGLETIELRTSPGGTLDLSGLDPSVPVLVTTDPVNIYADTILLPPGGSLTDMFSPAPNVFSGEDHYETAISPKFQTCMIGAGDKVVAFDIANLANIDDEISVAVSDTQGWLASGDGVLPLAAGETGAFEVAIEVPGSAGVCAINKVTVTASNTDGSYSEFAFAICADTDVDGDTVPNSCDICWNNSDTSQDDRDTDAVGDACDNCEDVFNPWQLDENGNRIGDACEPSVPATSPWALVAFALTTIAAGGMTLRRKNAA